MNCCFWGGGGGGDGGEMEWIVGRGVMGGDRARKGKMGVGGGGQEVGGGGGGRGTVDREGGDGWREGKQ